MAALVAAGVWVVSGGLSLLADVTVPVNPDKKGGGGLPPSIQGQKVTVVRGAKIEIELRAVTRSSRSVEFFVRKAPENGTVSKPETLPRDGAFNRARVVYQSSPTSTHVADEFLVAAKVRGGRMSGSVPVEITIEEPEPLLDVAPRLPFGAVMVGESIDIGLPVKNIGSAPYVPVFELAPPWSLAFPAEAIVIPPGETREIPFRFSPEKPGDALLEIKLGASKAVVVREGPPKREPARLYLTGSGLAPFSASPVILRPEWDPEQEVRIGTIQLHNATEISKVLTVTSPERITAPDKIQLEAGESKDVPIQVGGELGGFTGDVVFLWNTYSENVRVLADPVPPYLKFAADTPAVLPFPKVKKGTEQFVEVEVKNVGGAPGEVIADASPPFFLKLEEKNFKVPAGSSHKVSVGLSSPVVGEFSGKLFLYVGNQELVLQVAGAVVPSATSEEIEAARTKGRPVAPPVTTPKNLLGDRARPVGAAEPGKMNARMREFTAYLFQKGITTSKREFTKSVPPVQRVALKNRTQEIIELEWDHPSGGPFSYELEFERLYYIPAAQQMLKFWVPYTTVDFKEQGGRVNATVGGLGKGGVYTWRLITHQEGAGYSFPTQSFRVGTIQPPPFPWNLVLLGVLVVLVVAFVIFHRRANG